MGLLLYQLLLFAADAAVLWLARRWHAPAQRLGLILGYGFFALVLALPLGYLQAPLHAGFAFLNLCAWALFLHGAVLGGCMVLVDWSRSRRWSLVWGASTCALGLVALQAFVIEPRSLVVTHTTLESAKLHAPLTIAVVADLQTDSPGEFEAQALAAVRAAQPDLILFCGDYVQEHDVELYRLKRRKLNQLVLEAQLDAPLGAFAVRGNVEVGDLDEWSPVFAGTRVVCLEHTATLRAGEVLVTGLSLRDSFDSRLELLDPDLERAPERFHIVFGHGPDFALADLEADLCVAGHTHGGQVQLPGIGALLILSRIPLAWGGGGMHELPWGGHLFVSRGIGMERGAAPRLRFLCKPEVALLHLVPRAED